MINRKSLINSDRRIIGLRALRAKLNPEMPTAADVFMDYIEGSIARTARINRLVLARIHHLDGFPQYARALLKEAALIRKQGAGA